MGWHEHPGVRAGRDLTRGERAADLMRNGMGSWAFVALFCAFMAAWMGFNGHRGFDPYPYILLNLMLSTLAGLQGAILLIAAKRADQVSAELAMHDHQLLMRICEHLGLSTEDGAQ
jgi:uncharacterized membrane protein